MTVPEIVHSTLDGEEIATQVSLGSDDELFITSSRTLLYRSDGLLSDESVDEFPHDADRLTLSEGRRKTTFSLEYAIDGTRKFKVPASKTETILHPVLAGVLSGNEITGAGESVIQTYRFSELTLILTSDRLVKHIGEAVWDADFEQYHFEDVSNLSFEDGSVATQIVLVVDGRPQRIKAPNEHADNLRERLERALFAYHDVNSLEELNEDEEEDADAPSRADPASAFGEGVDPLDANSPLDDDTDPSAAGSSDAEVGAAESDASLGGSAAAATDSEVDVDSVGEVTEANAVAVDASSTAGEATDSESASGPARPEESDSNAGAFEGSGFEPATATDTELLERLESLEETVDRQTELLERQQRMLDQLIEELRAGR